MRIWLFVAVWVAWTGLVQAGAQEPVPDSTLVQAEADSLATLLEEVPLDSVLAQLGDSLFVPSPGRARKHARSS